MLLHRSHSFLIATLAAILVVGCQRSAPLVTVDLNRVRAMELALGDSPANTVLPSEAVAGQLTLNAEKPRTLLIGDGTNRMEEMLASIEEDRQNTLQRQLSRERRRILNEFEVQRNRILSQWQSDRSAAYVNLLAQDQTDVKDAAVAMGPLRSGIAWRVGWPDNDPFSRRRVSQPGIIPHNETSWLAAARADIAHGEARLDLNWEEQKGAIEGFYNARLQTDLFALAASEFEAVTLAQDAVRSRYADRSSDITNQFQSLRRNVPGESGASVNVSQTVTGMVVPPATAAPPMPDGDRVLLARFAESRGYDLRMGRAGARDVTDEYIEWRQRLLTLSRISPNSPEPN
ncbi:MAG: hypothetical protein KF812_08965 [Fimbriimonadaceae bacterium]|nr:hypothetical protein [Fimbriimonadaceae bacterium]